MTDGMTQALCIFQVCSCLHVFAMHCKSGLMLLHTTTLRTGKISKYSIAHANMKCKKMQYSVAHAAMDCKRCMPSSRWSCWLQGGVLLQRLLDLWRYACCRSFLVTSSLNKCCHSHQVKQASLGQVCSTAALLCGITALLEVDYGHISQTSRWSWLLVWWVSAHWWDRVARERCLTPTQV